LQRGPEPGHGRPHVRGGGRLHGLAHYNSTNGPRNTATFQVHVADAALSGSANAVSATAGSPFSGALAHVSDADPAGTAADYTATISWGDGTSGPGVVQASRGGGFGVSGGHTYTSAGAFTVTSTIHDAGGSNTILSASATVASAPTTTTTAPPTTTTTTTSGTTPPPQGGSSPARASFTLPSSVGAGGTVTLDASASRQPGVTIETYQWTVNGRQLANCAGATSELMTRTLPAGTDTIGLNLVGASGQLAAASHSIVVRPTTPGAHSASAPGRVRIITLPAEASCSLSPGDPPGGRVAPGVAYAPSLECRTQVQSGVIDAVGCLTEFQDSIQVTFVPHERGHGGSQHVTVPPGQQGLDGVQSAEDTRWLLQDVENALNPPTPRLCVDSNGNDYICSTVGVEQLPTAPSFGRGGPVEAGGGGAAGAARAGAVRATAAAAHGGSVQSIAFANDACAAAPTKKAQGETECLDLWVSTQPVRINRIDYAPPASGEIVVAPQFNLVVSQRASTSLDGLLLNPSQPLQPVNFELPARSPASASATANTAAPTRQSIRARGSPASTIRRSGMGCGPRAAP
jgi:hypothetical protein